MNFKFINKLFLVLIFFVIYSCQKLEEITKKENVKNIEIIDNEKYETSQFLSLKNNFECKIYKPLISKNLINSIE